MVLETHNVKRVRKIQEMGPKRRNVNGIFRHELRWGGSWGLSFEPDFSNVESRRDTPVRPPTFSAFRTAKQQVSRGFLQPPDLDLEAFSSCRVQCCAP